MDVYIVIQVATTLDTYAEERGVEELIEDRHVDGVFDSEEKAKDYIRKEVQKLKEEYKSNEYGHYPYMSIGYKWEKWEVQ